MCLKCWPTLKRAALFPECDEHVFAPLHEEALEETMAGLHAIGDKGLACEWYYAFGD